MSARHHAVVRIILLTDSQQDDDEQRPRMVAGRMQRLCDDAEEFGIAPRT